MKNLKTSPGVIVLFAAAVFSSQSLQAATPIWNAASGGTWSAPADWSPAVIPGVADDVQFGDVGAGNQNTMDAAFTIDSLTYNQDNQLTHTTLLNPGFTLTINRTTTGDPLTVNSTAAPTGANTLVPVAIQGPGAAMNVTSTTGDIVVRQGNGTAGTHMATLDLSGLDTFNATVGRLLVGQANAGAAVNRPSGTLLLAKTNIITLTSTAPPQVMVQDGGSNANGGTASVLTLGQVNIINADSFRLGGQKGNGNVAFNAVFANPSLVIRSHDTVSRASQIVVGDNSIVTSGNSAVANVDLTAGSVDILVDTNIIARGNPGPGTGTCTGTLGLSAGTMDVNTLEIGYQISTGANGAATATMNVGNNNIVTTNVNNGLVSTGAVVVVNTSMRLARTNSGGTGAVVGTLNITGGAVYANTVIAGGGNSTIVISAGGMLAVSNNAGTIASPIRNFSISDSSLTLPALNAGAVLAVSNFVAGGGQNTINISSLPPIGSYPATFTLISSVVGSSGNMVLGTLPVASPSYVGSIVDSGNGTVQLKLTAGPVVDLSILWTGTQSADWDIGTLNWLSHGTPAAFFAGATPIFDDSALNTGVNLATSISSGTVTVSNNVVTYDFFGPGNIAGASALVKKGPQTLIIENEGVDNFGSVTIANGTLQIGNGDTNGDISTLSIIDNNALVVNRVGSINLSAAIAGTGTITKFGSGTLTLSGASTYSGATALNEGGLEVDGSLGGAGALTTAAGTLLTGSGSIAGPVIVQGALNPGGVNTPGTLTVSNGLALEDGSSLTFDLNGASPSTASDTINVVGNLNVTNTTINANFQGVPSAGNNYQLFTYTGALGGSFNPTVSGSHFTLALDTTSVPGAVFVDVTGGQGSSLVWSTTGDTTWDSTKTNWTDLNTHTPSLFYSGDSVLLDDTTINPNLVIPAGVAVYPAVITNISDTANFSISGAGKISGTASIVKGGQSTLSIATANDFTGTVDIQNGVLQTLSGTALATAATTVEAGGTLDVDGQSLGGVVVTIAGDGFNGQGAVVNSGGALNTAFRSLVLSSNASVGGTGQWALNNSGGAASLSTGGQPFKLTKVGANLVGLQNLTTVDPALGDIEIAAGILEFNGLTPNMGDPTHTNFVDAGATLQFASGSAVWNKFFDLTGNGSASTVNNGTAALTELAGGGVTLHSGVVINVGGTSMTISAPIGGDGSLTKSGTSPLILSNVDTYTGDTVINAGAMRLAGNATILNTTNITIAAGATLTVTGRVDATFTLVSGQNLMGAGTIAGSLVTLAGSTLSPGGLGTIGTLTVSNTITLGGTNIMELNQDSKTNDILFCNSAITYGGVLSLPSLGSNPLTNGASFKLFKAGSYSGSFASITPATPGTGLLWNTNALTTGIIAVTNNGTVVGPTTNATIYSVKISAGNIVLHGTNHNVPANSFHYAVLSSTNVTLPLSNWTPVVTNSFNSDGSFDYSMPINQTLPRQFLDVKAVP